MYLRFKVYGLGLKCVLLLVALQPLLLYLLSTQKPDVADENVASHCRGLQTSEIGMVSMYQRSL